MRGGKLGNNKRKTDATAQNITFDDLFLVSPKKALRDFNNSYDGSESQDKSNLGVT